MVSPRVALLLGVALHCASAKEAQQYFETPHQQFFALGGKETPAKVIVHGNDRCGLQTHIAATESVSLCERTKS